MAKEIETSYTFDATNKKVVLTDRTSVEAAKLYAIINITRGAMYYTLGASDKVVTISGNEITLNAGVSTSGHSNDDVLFILYEDTEILEVLQAIRRGINTLCNTVGTAMSDGAGRLRVQNDGTSIGTVTTLSNMSSIGSVAANQLITANVGTASSMGFRSNIVVTE